MGNEIAELRAYVEQRLGQVADAVDETRLNLSSHRVAIQDALTQLDLSFRAILVSMDTNVGDSRTTVRAVRTAVTSLQNALAALQSDVATVKQNQASLAQALAAVQADVSEIKTSVQAIQMSLT